MSATSLLRTTIALTTDYADTANVSARIRSRWRWTSWGRLDPEVCTLFVQSHVPPHFAD